MNPSSTAHAQLLIDTINAVQAVRRVEIDSRLDSYGILAHLAARLQAIQNQSRPRINRRAVCIFASDHGVAEEGVSLYPQDVTKQMMRNFLRGGAGINAIARVCNCELVLVDMGVRDDFQDIQNAENLIHRKIAWGSQNIVCGPAMTRAQAIQGLITGIEMALRLAPTNDVLIAGEKGIGNTTPSAAVVSVLMQADPLIVTGRGTGLDDAGRIRKVKLVAQSIAKNEPDAHDVIDVLAKVGGFDMAGMAGFYLGAAAAGKPVILDGFISGAAALIAARLQPLCSQYFFAGHRSAEQGHAMVLSELGLQPMIDLDFRLGEATGATLSLTILDGAVALL